MKLSSHLTPVKCFLVFLAIGVPRIQCSWPFTHSTCLQQQLQSDSWQIPISILGCSELLVYVCSCLMDVFACMFLRNLTLWMSRRSNLIFFLQVVPRQPTLSCLSLCTLLFKSVSEPSICCTPVQVGDCFFTMHSR